MRVIRGIGFSIALLLSTAAFSEDFTPGGDNNPAMDSAGQMLSPALQGGNSEERAAAVHNQMIDNQMNRTQSQQGDGAMLRAEQNYSRQHNSGYNGQ